MIIRITEKMRIVDVDGRRLLGECKRCGKCCKINRDCPEVVNETLDGKPWHVCKIYFDRPVRCAIWPLSGDPIPEGCGFHYED